MNEPNTNPFELLIDAIAEAVVKKAGALNGGKVDDKLLTPEELADRLKVPLSWVYEQSRQGNIPTHRMGRYIRFNLCEVIESQKKNGSPS